MKCSLASFSLTSRTRASLEGEREGGGRREGEREEGKREGRRREEGGGKERGKESGRRERGGEQTKGKESGDMCSDSDLT